MSHFVLELGVEELPARFLASLERELNDRFAALLKSGKILALFNGHVHGCYAASICGISQFTAESLKTDFDLFPDRISYHDQSGFQMVSFDEYGDWRTERFIQHPKTEIYFEKMF